MSVVNAFADLVYGDDFSVDASVFLAFVRRFPLGAGNPDAAESSGHGGVAIRSSGWRRLDLTLGQVAIHLLAGFTFAVSAIISRAKFRSDVILHAVVNTLFFWFALSGVAIDVELATHAFASTITSGILNVLETTALFVRGAAVTTHPSLLGRYI